MRGPFGDFEGKYRVFGSKSEYRVGNYSKLVLRKNGTVLQKKYRRNQLLGTCTGRGKFRKHGIAPALVIALSCRYGKAGTRQTMIVTLWNGGFSGDGRSFKASVGLYDREGELIEAGNQYFVLVN